VGKHAASSWMWCERFRRTGEEKEERTEWMNANPIRTMSIIFSVSFSLSQFFFSFPLPSCTPSDDRICQFSFLTFCVRMRMKMEMRFFSSILFFASSCLHLKAKNFLLLFFYSHIIYMRALKDDARFDLFLTLYCLYAWKKEIYIDDKSKNTKENIE